MERYISRYSTLAEVATQWSRASGVAGAWYPRIFAAVVAAYGGEDLAHYATLTRAVILDRLATADAPTTDESGFVHHPSRGYSISGAHLHLGETLSLHWASETHEITLTRGDGDWSLFVDCSAADSPTSACEPGHCYRDFGTDVPARGLSDEEISLAVIPHMGQPA